MNGLSKVLMPAGCIDGPASVGKYFLNPLMKLSVFAGENTAQRCVDGNITL